MQKGKPHPNKPHFGFSPSQETRDKIGKALRGKNVGPNNGCWKGGVTSLNQSIRISRKYRKWRLSVFEKDGFGCVCCGDNRGGNLQAHHILSFSEYPEARFDVNNGTTLCKECHTSLHNVKRKESVA